MVEQTRQPSHVVSLQAGPGEASSGAQVGTNLSLRINDRAAQILGRQLAVIGDRMDEEWAGRKPSWLPTGLHVLRPAHGPTRTTDWDIQTHVWGFQGLSAAAKAWIQGTLPGKGIQRAHTWAAWVSNAKPVSRPGWTRGVLGTVMAAVAAAFLMHYWTVAPSAP